MSRRVLCVDDELHVLNALVRQHGKRFELQTALGVQQGVMALKNDGPFGVVVSDLRMPGLDGISFLSLARRTSPDTVRIMLTGHGDLQSALAAVNEGKIFQFLTKPCPPERLAQTIDTALEQHRLIKAERELQEKTLHGMVAVLSEILSLVSPVAFSRANRIRRYVQQMSAFLELQDAWQYELAAMLCQVGCVSLPSDILDRLQAGQTLSEGEKGIVREQVRLGHDLLSKIPRLDKVAEMVLRQAVGWSGDRGIDDPIKIGGQMLKVALDFDQHLTQGKAVADAIDGMQNRLDYHPALKEALRQIQAIESNSETFRVSISQLEPGMVTSKPVFAKNGLLLVGAGQEMAESAIARINGFARTLGVIEPITVTVPAQPKVTSN
jgi:response regulator RpfG family c-di-GMP phosphodiesterase